MSNVIPIVLHAFASFTVVVSNSEEKNWKMLSSRGCLFFPYPGILQFQVAKVTKLVSAQRRLTLLSERDDPDFSTDMLQAKRLES